MQIQMQLQSKIKKKSITHGTDDEGWESQFVFPRTCIGAIFGCFEALIIFRRLSDNHTWPAVSKNGIWNQIWSSQSKIHGQE